METQDNNRQKDRQNVKSKTVIGNGTGGWYRAWHMADGSQFGMDFAHVGQPTEEILADVDGHIAKIVEERK